jgi:hypothetical protein
MNDVKLNELKGLANHFEARKARAAERLKSSSGNGWHFAILGLKLSGGDFEFDEVARFSRVDEPPGEVELASALQRQHLFSAVGRYSQSITHELSIPEESGSADGCFNIAWWIVSLVRVRTGAEILIPAVSDRSWSVIAALPPKSCLIQLLEDVPMAKKLGEQAEVQESDLHWVKDNLLAFARLLEQPKFRTAVDALTTHHLQHSERMVAAMLWAGIESLFGIQSELRYRLSILMATALEPTGVKRLEVYRRVKKLYDERSKAVHGGSIDSGDLHAHVLEVKRLLSRLISRYVEIGELFSEKYLEEMLLAGETKNA